MLRERYCDSEGPLLTIERAQKSYGGRLVLTVDKFELHRNDFLLLVGPNASGKSTFLRLVAGVSKLSSGTLTRAKALQGLRTCFVPQSGGTYQNLTVDENARALAQLVGAKAPVNLQARWYVSAVGLDRYLNTKVRELSGGYQKLASIACALCVEPRALYLDEPFAGVDRDRGAALGTGLAELTKSLEFLIVTAHSADSLLAPTQTLELSSGKICSAY